MSTFGRTIWQLFVSIVTCGAMGSTSALAVEAQRMNLSRAFIDDGGWFIDRFALLPANEEVADALEALDRHRGYVCLVKMSQMSLTRGSSAAVASVFELTDCELVQN
jgi:hypothetical protein